jgi:tyramine---L-glutamate ligase
LESRPAKTEQRPAAASFRDAAAFPSTAPAMHIFAWEALTAGVWPDAPASMLREGGAMLAALVEDLLRIDGCRVSTIEWESGRRKAEGGSSQSDRVDHSPLTTSAVGLQNDRLSTVVPRSPAEESTTFERLAAAADLCWLIAPETHGLLAERCRRVEAAGGTLAGPSSAAVQLCGDKLELAAFLASREIPTIPTQPFDLRHIPGISENPGDVAIVVKPRHGAGSEGVRLLRSFRLPPSAVRLPYEFVWQPFHPGRSVSVAAIIGREITVFPVCRQLLADDGTFAYLGGEFPLNTDRNEEIEQLVRRVCETIDGLRGYVGFDLILPEIAEEPAVLVEINPRLTTSYVGYRRLTEDNIAQRALGEPGASATGGVPVLAPNRWQKTPLRFFPDGRVVIAPVRRE